MHLFHKIIISVIIITSAGISAEDYKLYKVQEGDTLHKIAKEQLNDARKWKEFLKYNKIDSPNLIRPGLELKIPASLAKQQPSQANPIA
ncbi:MAG: LysM peptidoglycan-binding domain-containing protein, partial [Leptospira sp.]|nr:LysM peptidoglycan-binding domain-containing protein [Leptospira sp.]